MIQSLERALDILDVISRSKDGASLRSIAEQVQLNRTTVHNQLRTLRERGYLEQERGGAYRLGVMVSTLATRRSQQGLFKRAEEQMLQLHAAVPPATLTFSELVGQEIWCRLRVAPGVTGGALQWPSAQSFSPYGSATGICFQAFCPAYREQIAEIQEWEEAGGSLWASRERFEAALAETLRRGVAKVDGGMFVRLAIPVGEGYALGLNIAKSEAFPVDTLLARLRESAIAMAEMQETATPGTNPG